MSPEQLAARHTAAIQRHWRTLVDSGGKASAQLLFDLEAIAETHARSAAGTPLTDDHGHPVRADGSVIPETPEAVEAREARVRGEAPVARRRTTARKR